jgi:hypothetical protein
MKNFAISWSALFILLVISNQSHSAIFSPDTLKILAIRVEFQADTSETTTGDGTFDLTQGTDSLQIDPPPHNKNYFEDHLLFARNYFMELMKHINSISPWAIIIQIRPHPK